ncbi:hypothetical protein Goklo_025077 [Gossypium klotzschianum]|uniref:Uncharacterized protein n=1 Tax=Gossypium klotzschianum TaxID=34286 RepID=A0A7J8WDI9_9ROSI|nr:hypothetical protein [Gossypium klotzschianum]
MHVGKQVRVGSSDVRSSYSHGSTVTFERLIGFHIESSPKTIHY